MDSKRYTKVEDFILDDTFVEYTLGTDASNTVFWDSYLSRYPECTENLLTAQRILLSIKIRDHETLNDEHVEDIIKNVQKRYRRQDSLPSKTTKIGLSIILKYAAIFLLVFGSGLFIYDLYYKTSFSGKNITANKFRNIVNHRKEHILIKLPDSSTVVLSPASRLSFPEKFTGKIRQVNLEGDAFFEVTKNKHKPFYVLSKNMKIRVVGTSFLIREDLKRGESQVLVSTGKVEVSLNPKSERAVQNRKYDSKTVLLQANEEAIFHSGGTNLEKVRIKEPMPLSIKSTLHIFNFSATPFSSVVNELEKAYNISIKFDKKLMANCQLTASLVDQPLDERLRLICKAVEATYRYEDGGVVIEGKGCSSSPL